MTLLRISHPVLSGDLSHSESKAKQKRKGTTGDLKWLFIPAEKHLDILPRMLFFFLPG